MGTILNCVIPNGTTHKHSLSKHKYIVGSAIHSFIVFWVFSVFVLVLPASVHSQDKDNDSVIDLLDMDSDNDGILNEFDGLICEAIDLSMFNGQLDALSSFNNAMITIGGPDGALIQVESPLETNGSAMIDEFVISNEHILDSGTDSTSLLLGVAHAPGETGASNSLGTNYTFSQPVCNFNFVLFDIDRTDEVAIIGTLNGAVVPYTVESVGPCLNFNMAASTVTSTCNVQANPGNGNVSEHRIAIIFDGCIDRLEFDIYDSADGNGGSFTFLPAPEPACVAFDTDMDGVVDFLDLDSDNDGISDAIEACGDINLVLENCTLDFNGDGDYVIVNGESTGLLVGTCTDAPIDTDGDSIPDFLDLDSDGDGCPDAIEACTASNPNVNSSAISDNFTPPANGVDPCGLVFDVDGATSTCEIPASINFIDSSVACLDCSTNLITNAVCTNADGSASVEAIGGNAPFMYLWSSGETTSTAIALPAGTATVTVTDDCGAESICSIDIPMDPCDMPCVADAGTISNALASDCLPIAGGTVNLTATPDGNEVAPAGFDILYVLTTGSTLTILQTNASPSFDVSAVGDYTIHTLVFDPTTLDLSVVIPGTTIATDILDIVMANDLCASLDATGASVDVLACADMTTCIADAGTLSSAIVSDCLSDGASVNLTATADGNTVVPAGFDILYVLTTGTALTILQTNAFPSFDVSAIGDYTIHTLVFDPTTLDLSVVVPGTTVATDVLAIIMTNDLCASLDAAGASVSVIACDVMTTCTADAGTLSSVPVSDCLTTGASVTLTATPNGDAVAPAGFSTIYALTLGSSLTILDTNPTPQFTVNSPGSYAIHTLIFDPSTLDLSVVLPGTTTATDVLNIISSNDICADLDAVGTVINVEICQECIIDAGTVSDGISLSCLETDMSVGISASADGNAIIPNGFTQLFVLTQGDELVILETNSTPDFLVDEIGMYTIHSLIFDPATLDLSVIVPGITTGFDVANLFSNGNICAALDVAGAPLNVTTCDCVSLNCFGSLNVSLGADCQAIIDPTFGSPNVTQENISQYEIIINLHGEAIPGNILTSEHIGEVVTFQINFLNPICPNSCWGNLLVEDKFRPELICPDTIITIDCVELFEDPGPVILNNCSNDEIMIVDEVVEPLQCDPDYIQRVTRTYVAKDDQGNKSEPCSQTILIERLPSVAEDPDSWMAAPNFTIPLGTALECGTVADTSIIGFPTFRGIYIEDLSQLACNVIVLVTEDTLRNLDCKQIIIKEYGVFDWTCQGSDTLFHQLQVIEFFDDQAPIVLHPVADFTASTGSSGCSGFVKLPVVEYEDNCNTVRPSVSYPHGFIDNYTEVQQVDLDVGINEIIYTGTDPCGNIVRDTTLITVEDKTPPVAICKVAIGVSLTSDGKAVVPAEVFDEGSFDDCKLDKILVRKINADACGLGQDTIFQESLTFCCEETGEYGGGNLVMVVIRVIDKQGLFNECTLLVDLQDRGTLSVQGLPDITISCDFPFPTSNLDVFGSIVQDEYNRKKINIEDSLVQFSGPALDGFFTGACSPGITEDIIDDNRNQCGIGQLTRKITITSGFTEQVVEQNITVVPTEPFFINEEDPRDTLDDIIWPLDVVGMSGLGMCDAEDYAPDQLPEGFQRPIILNNSQCNLVAASITNEEVFSGISDPNVDACFKILREWTVIDWCQVNNSNGPKRWTFTQIIEINNETRPEILCEDISVESTDSECGPVIIQIGATATDDCSGDNLSFQYIIDLFEDGNFDANGKGVDVDFEFPIGQHVVFWQVEDRCGNISETCEQIITVTNIKSPPAFCIQGIATDLILMDRDNDGIPETPLAIVTPHAINGSKKDSLDCLGEPLIFSFSADTSDVIREFGCALVGLQTIRLFVTDSQGNQAFCTTTIDIQDNKNLCGDDIPLDPCDIPPICNDLQVDINQNGIVNVIANSLFTGTNLQDCIVGSFDFRFGPDGIDSRMAFDCDDVGITTDVELILTNDDNFFASCQGTITINDPNDFCNAICIDPVAQCIGNLPITLNQIGSADVASFQIFSGSADVDCDDEPLTFAFDPAGNIQTLNFTCPDIGTNNITLFVIQTDGSFTSCTSTVEVSDPNLICPQVCFDPVASCQPSILIDLDANGMSSITVDDVFNGSEVTDCDGNPFTIAFNGSGTVLSRPFNCNNVGSNEIDLFLITQGGMITSCRSIVQVSDPLNICPNLCFDPIAECIDTFFLEINSVGQGSVSARLLFTGDSTVDCDGDPLTFAFDELGENGLMSFNCGSLGDRSSVLFVINDEGQFTSCMTVLNIRDSGNNCPDVCVDPIASCVPSLNLVLNDSGMVSASANQIFNGTSLEECDGDQLTLSFNSNGNMPFMPFNCSSLGTQTLTLFALSDDGNMTSCQSSVTISDINNSCTGVCMEPMAMCDPSFTTSIGSDGTLRLDAVDIYSGMMFQDCDGNDLQFSFSPDPLNAARTFECLNVGTQSVNLYVTTGDGSQTSCMTFITITDPNSVCCNILPTLVCEAPTFEINVFDFNNDGLVDSSGATLLATDLIGEGTDMLDCDGIPLQFSLSSNVDIVSRVFDCSNIGINNVRLWATNGDGFSTFCNTTATIQDSQNQCPSEGIAAGILEGFVRTEQDISINDAELVLRGNEISTDMTNELGYYAFENMPLGESYRLRAQKTDTYINGLTTLDLVLIQQHILNRRKLDSPYKILAADVDVSDNIAINDVVAIRKLLLGVTNDLPTTSWQFVSEDQVFFDPANPSWSSAFRDYQINQFEEDLEVNFIGIKMGDVNNTVYAAESRTDNATFLSIENRELAEKQIVSIPIIAGQDVNHQLGLQMKLNHSSIKLMEISSGALAISEDQYYTSDGQTTIIWSSEEPIDIQEGDLLFELTIHPEKAGLLSEYLSIEKRVFSNELYAGIDLEIARVDIKWEETKEKFTVSQNNPNPWNQETEIRFSIQERGMIGLRVYDVSGQMIIQENKKFQAGNHSWTLQKEQLSSSGLYYLEMSYKGSTKRQKILLIE